METKIKKFTYMVKYGKYATDRPIFLDNKGNKIYKERNCYERAITKALSLKGVPKKFKEMPLKGLEEYCINNCIYVEFKEYMAKIDKGDVL